ncbi:MULTISPECIES: ABC transporter permease [unclassified Arthrobacter]|uniref:ABC transporter permease n=1 Tax=unclassified Arthrobacter TaxID=235627 RepID=UPI001D14A2A4|nr:MULTISPECIES: ABC transporter permease [unclassified Arthrobacter]MCC3275585.1 ABC transporter permease [Arthrobacter sp. zg-Y20]MCC3278658.1 ABC transporter permease [Arthrobacter sp. zg-Y40]MCC9177025.1 ABC transporter permease [Arthrobacter sp. zg-Y750]MDK1315742.1 ABC transporter permease [Arthrobacter sp. zg.Y20]MDK1326264.1 ABC transporter permease [Arthrobacter sp. zg-Y1143]
MNAAVSAAGIRTGSASSAPVRWAGDGWTVTKRNLIKIKRSPDMIIFAVLQPIMFVLLFSQVYGGSINVAGTDYTQYLMAGIFAQTVVFGSTFSGAAMAQDLKEGIIDRFRTLPMSPSAVLIGRTNSDLALNAISMIIMMGTGLLVGWRVNTNFASFLAAVGLLLLFSYAFSWVMALLGMSVRTPETINNASFIILFPITFISNAFVQSSTLPEPLRIFADWNPVSALVQAARELFGNVGTAPVPDTWPMQNAIPTVVIGSLVLLVVFVPLAVRKFQSISSR